MDSQLYGCTPEGTYLPLSAVWHEMDTSELPNTHLAYLLDSLTLLHQKYVLFVNDSGKRILRLYVRGGPSELNRSARP